MIYATPVEEYFKKKKNFGILIASIKKESPQKNITRFVSVAIINPQTHFIGFVSFFPDTRLNENDIASIGENIALGEIKNTLQSVSTLLSTPIPFYITIDEDKIPFLIDIMEGLKYFIWQPDIIEKEKLPDGEFIMDGSVVSNYLNIQGSNEYTHLSRLQRYYNLLLNTWNQKQEKWKILKNEYLFKIITNSIKKNISNSDLYLLGDKLFNNDTQWLPYFWEIPVKKEDDILVMNQEATVFYLRKFIDKINSTKNFYTEQEPNIEIKNGTTIPNLAKKTRDEFSRKGFKILEFSNADKNDYENTILLDNSGNTFYLQTAINSLKVKKSYHTVNKSNFTDLILILGKDYQTILDNATDTGEDTEIQ